MSIGQLTSSCLIPEEKVFAKSGDSGFGTSAAVYHGTGTGEESVLEGGLEQPANESHDLIIFFFSFHSRADQSCSTWHSDKFSHESEVRYTNNVQFLPQPLLTFSLPLR